MNSNISFRYMKNIKIANSYNLIPLLPIIDVKNLKLSSIYNLRKLGYDPLEIINNYAKCISLHELMLDMFKKIGAGFSPWIILAYTISAVSQETNDKTK